MPGPKDLGYLDCSIAQNVDIIGDRWNVLILRDAFMGVRRFEDFANDLGIARNILSNRLDRLVSAGVFETVQYQEHPPRDEYRLTDKGKGLMDVLLALWRWGDRWSPPTGDLRQLVHLDCGKPTYSVAACAHCGGELKRSNLRIEPGLDVVDSRLAKRHPPALSPSPVPGILSERVGYRKYGWVSEVWLGIGSIMMTVTWGPAARRKALALVAAFCLLGSLTIVFSPRALGNGSSPSAECASTNPDWNGDFWKVEKDDDTLSEVETNIPGAITLTANGSWTNNNEDPVFRVVLKIDDDDDEQVAVLSGIWATGEGGTIDATLSGLDHVTFCSTSEVAGSEPTTTTTSPAPTTTAVPTTTTAAGPATTTTAGPTTTTTPDATIATLPESTTTTPSDDTTTSAANPTDASDSALTNDELQGDETVEESEGSETDDSGLSPEADRDTTAAGLTNGGPGEPPAAEQELSSDAAPYVFRSPHQWTLADLAILGVLIAATAGLLARKSLRRLIGHLGERWR